MTIRKGEEWGHKGVVPASFVIAEDDHDAASQPPHVPFALCRGDMFEALGTPRLPKHQHECMLVPIDAMECSIVDLEGNVDVLYAFSHVAVGSWWRGRFTIVSNSGFFSGLHVAPRSHPNDGEFDVITLNSEMKLQQRYLARRKARTGTHVPHPDISIKRGTHFETQRSFQHERLSIDGVAISQWLQICLSIRPDYWEVLL